MTVRNSSSEHWEEGEFRAVFLRHYPRIVALLIRLLCDRSRAEEMANDAFWRQYHQPALQVDGNIAGCRYPTATHLGTARFRGSRPRPQYAEATGGPRGDGKDTRPLEGQPGQ